MLYKVVSYWKQLRNGSKAEYDSKRLSTFSFGELLGAGKGMKERAKESDAAAPNEKWKKNKHFITEEKDGWEFFNTYFSKQTEIPSCSC